MSDKEERGMTRVEVLREQASLLRRLADSFDISQMKADLLNLAQRCEALAEGAPHGIIDRPEGPVGETPA